MALKKHTIFYLICRNIILLFGKIYWRLSSKGTENIPKEGGVLLVANHFSYLDPPLIGSLSPRPVHILAKYELFRVPIFNWLIKALGAIPIKRDVIDRKSLRTAVDILKNGCVLLVFPEGTRTRDGSIGKPKPGPGLIAKLADTAILPVYIEGSYKSLPRKRLFPKPNKITVYFGKSFTINELGYDKQTKNFVYKLSDFMIDRIKELKRELEK